MGTSNSIIKQRLVIAAIVLLALIAMITGMLSSARNQNKNKPTDFSHLNATVLQLPRTLSHFVLTDNHNQNFTEKNLQNHWTLMFFGFTHCPDICPATLAQLKNMYQNLEQSHSKVLPQIVLVSVDPQRDTPNLLHQYVTSFNPNFIGVTGEKEQIDKLAQALGIAYIKINPQAENMGHQTDHGQHMNADQTVQASNTMNYQIEHSGTITLFNPAGKVAGFFTMPHNSEQLAYEFQIISQTLDK